MTPAATDVPWQELKHAFGRAHDMPVRLAAVSQSHGRRLRKQMEKLWERVLHQGTIYSASPPAVRELIPMAVRARGNDKALFYGVLAEFASSARQAVRDGRAIPCCRGGDSEHGAAILGFLLDARDRIAPDLANSDRHIRRLAASLLCCSADASNEAGQAVRSRYAMERDPAMRRQLLDALTRVRARCGDWAGFLTDALQRESDPALRFALLHAQIRELRSAADEAAAGDLIAAYFAACASESGGNEGELCEALHWLGAERELSGLVQALEGCADRNAARLLAERMLRLVFQDGRSGWGDTTRTLVRQDGAPQPQARLPKSILKGLVKIAFMVLFWRIFPFLLRRRLRKSRDGTDGRRYKIEYWGVKGEQPELPIRLTPGQRTALSALADRPEVWIDQTNLWALFGLPDNAAALQALVAARS